MMLQIIQRNLFLCIAFALMVGFAGCKKFLDEKPDQTLTVPSTLQDLQSLLDNYLQVNQRDPSAGEISADDYYLSDADFAAMNETDRNMYTWQKNNLFADGIDNDWARCYLNVGRANQVLYGINRIKREPNDEAAWNNTKGNALYLRGRAFLMAISIWSVAYDQATAGTDPGIPLRLSPDFNEPSVRASVQTSYDQVIKDFKEAAGLLPETALHVVRPSKAAAFGMLARTYLWMRKYDSCFKYADSCLQLRSGLKNYSELNAGATYPFSTIRYTNPEDLSNFIIAGPPAPLSISRAKIDSTLYNAYDVNDLRKKIYFRVNTGINAGTYAFKGSYFGSSVPYNGIATDEVWLMRAECFARTGNKQAALDDLNTVLSKRWNNAVVFVPAAANDAGEALQKVLLERRKELIFRGLRFMDIKRLNREGVGIVLRRRINGEIISLQPNDKRYALPIPADVIALSGMQQNER